MLFKNKVGREMKRNRPASRKDSAARPLLFFPGTAVPSGDGGGCAVPPLPRALLVAGHWGGRFVRCPSELTSVTVSNSQMGRRGPKRGPLPQRPTLGERQWVFHCDTSL